MPTEMVRKHFLLPKELADRFEKLVGARKQSEEVAELIRQRLLREERATFFRENAGFLSAEDYPEWDTAEDVANWVRNLRATGWERPEVSDWQKSQLR